MAPLSASDLAVLATRTLIVVVVLVVGFRVLGKREASQLTVYDLVLIMLVANAIQNAMTQGRGQLLVGLVDSTVIILSTWAIVRFVVRRPLLERLALGSPVILVNEGRVLKDRLRRQHISRHELDETVRSHGLDSISEVHLAVLEIDGSISVVPAHHPSD